MSTLSLISRILVIVGALNWGLVGLFQFDLVAAIVGLQFGEVNMVSRIIYILVALAGIYELLTISSRPAPAARSVNRH